jgi:5-hydroxyisourate hydrolase-like protein (transthyretin family)
MKRTDLASKVLVLVVLILGSVFGDISMVFGQGLEEEPNHPCPTAQNFGAIALPFTVNGSLDSTPEFPDVDFFTFTGTPGASVRVDLEGAPTGKGTLGDPFLGFFDSTCNLIAFNYDFPSSRLVLTIPADGVFIMAATVCCDGGFTGGGVGTYQMTITPIAAIGSISGRVVDAATGDPLPGNTDPFASVRLLRCEEFGCFDVYNQSADNEGRFHFTNDFSGQPLEVGTYQVIAFANGYQQGQTDPFGVAEGEDRDVGDVPLQPIPAIGSISGRVVDAATGDPLPGNTDPFASVQLLRCEEFGCFNVSDQSTDNEGRFHFTNDFSGQPLEVGTYQVIAFANEYIQGQTDPFGVAEGEDRDVGDVPLQPFPVRISEIRPCGSLPPEGGTCSYSVRVTNRLDSALDGAAWSLVDSSGIGSLIDFTHFQTANPQRMTLAPGASKVVQFAFDVPNTVRDGAFICTQVFIGQNRLQPFFNTAGQRGLFCISKGFTGVFSVVPEKEAQKMFRQMNGRTLPPPKGK